MTKTILTIVLTALLTISSIWFGSSYLHLQNNTTEKTAIQSKPIIHNDKLSQYSFPALQKRTFEPADFTIFKKVEKLTPPPTGGASPFATSSATFSTFLFKIPVEGRTVSGLMNVPDDQKAHPVIIMFRGYVDREAYTPGEGTRNSAEALAKAGFITIAPDFFGYGESDKAEDDSLLDRFQSYTTGLTILASIPKLQSGLQKYGVTTTVDQNKIGMWGHSNGGQIAMSVAAISGKPYPLVLWAPVSKPFPYSILYFTDEYDDEGKYLRGIVADFEKNHDVREYSLTSHLDWIKSPISLHQGTADSSIPTAWSDLLDETLTGAKVNVDYYTYLGENHNFQLGSWPQAIGRSIDFYNKEFKK